MTQWTAPEALVYLMQIRLCEEEPAEMFDPRPHPCPEPAHVFGGLPHLLSGESEEVRAWLEDVTGTGVWRATPDPASRRVYASWEERALGPEGGALLDELAALGVLDVPQRESVVDRVLALDVPDIEPEDLCWLVLGVLNGASDVEESEGVTWEHRSYVPDSDERH